MIMANEVKVPCGGFKLGQGLSIDGDVVGANREVYSMRIEQVQTGPSTFEYKFSEWGDIKSLEQLQKVIHGSIKPIIYDGDAIYDYVVPVNYNRAVDMTLTHIYFSETEPGYIQTVYNFDFERKIITATTQIVSFALKG